MSFVPGLQLSRQFYWQAVRPVLEDTAPGLPHTAALIGSGSEVLGFDTEMSSDHHWGPRVLIFLADGDFPGLAQRLSAALAGRLPRTFLGYPTNFSQPDPLDNGTQLLRPLEQGPINHRVEFFSLGGYFQETLGLDPRNSLSAIDWLLLEEQRLRTVTAGEVFHDGLGGLEPLRQKLAWYPADVWLYLLAAEWAKIGQEEPFVGRCGSVGDDTGSRLVAARLAHSLMRLGFLMEKQYPPYSKWFGTGFSRLECAAELAPPLAEALAGGAVQAGESRAEPLAVSGVLFFHQETQAHQAVRQAGRHQARAGVVAHAAAAPHEGLLLADLGPLRRQQVQPHVRRVPGQLLADRLQPAQPIMIDLARRHRAQALLFQQKPVDCSKGIARVKAQIILEESTQGEELHPVVDGPLLQRLKELRAVIQRVRRAEVGGITQERARQAPGQGSGKALRLAGKIVVCQEDQDARPPVMVAGHLCIEAQHLRAAADQGR